MTTITRNLPWFIRDLGISIVGSECYTSLVENLDINDVKCIKYSLSKGLGIGIVVGGSIMKVPQVLLIVNARSARGLSLSAYVLETLSYAINLAYSFRNGFPFSTYGENFFLTIQNAIITLLIIAYAPIASSSVSLRNTKLTTGVVATIASSTVLYSLPNETLALLQLGTLPLSLFSKLPQIRQNYRSQSTGQLSAFAVISQIAGCLARLFTTATEIGDNLVAAGFALALLLNLVLGAQLWMYWGQGEAELKGKHELRNGAGYVSDSEKIEKERPSPSPVAQPAPWQAPQHRRVATPPPRTTSAGGARKWTRKVD
ncbi:Mannose-P-dolichol utilization defect 1 [Hypsizygus marmoreus]|uniref:Mannose-P-dolichol utilization defect 1 n=1 Tax=Hypsizygus marmoreus TaxID=39966 RepID=A0A369JGD2_HYPMA|nr:Mannose-P-dolichol utilization defect 1 [Hypsizygus marmoreus]